MFGTGWAYGLVWSGSGLVGVRVMLGLVWVGYLHQTLSTSLEPAPKKTCVPVDSPFQPPARPPPPTPDRPNRRLARREVAGGEGALAAAILRVTGRFRAGDAREHFPNITFALEN